MNINLQKTLLVIWVFLGLVVIITGHPMMPILAVDFIAYPALGLVLSYFTRLVTVSMSTARLAKEIKLLSGVSYLSFSVYMSFLLLSPEKWLIVREFSALTFSISCVFVLMPSRRKE